MSIEKRKKIAGYKGASKRLLLESEKQKDLRQASEKLWGAAALVVKAVAEKRGWEHDGHADLFKVVNRLTKITRDPGLWSPFQVANSLHWNFYENQMTSEDIEKGREDVKKFIEKLEKLL
jgi:hypothetical protein